MDIRSIRKLIEIVEQSDIAEIEIKEGEHNIRITRSKEPVMMQAPAQMAYQTAPVAHSAPAAPAETPPPQRQPLLPKSAVTWLPHRWLGLFIMRLPRMQNLLLMLGIKLRLAIPYVLSKQ